MITFFVRSIVAGLLLLYVGLLHAGPLAERIAAGKSIRIGFANEVPFAYPGENNEPLGLVNKQVLSVLESMGYTDIEPVVTDWGGLIPGLKANRFDIITGGMYITGKRCENVAFSEPVGRFGDGFIVPAGNPKAINNYQDIKDQEGVLATGAGYHVIEVAKKSGLTDKNMMIVPGFSEILAAVVSGRADAGAINYFAALNLAEKSGGKVEATDPAAFPEWTLNYSGIGFRFADQDFLDKFNQAQAAYMGSKKMLDELAEYGYTSSLLPGDTTAAWACENR